jgi:hypothetical protein
MLMHDGGLCTDKNVLGVEDNKEPYCSEEFGDG